MNQSVVLQRFLRPLNEKCIVVGVVCMVNCGCAIKKPSRKDKYCRMNVKTDYLVIFTVCVSTRSEYQQISHSDIVFVGIRF